MVEIEMPKYKSHKEVWALKIKSIVRDGEGENRESDGSAIITPEEEGYAPFRVEGEYLHKHKPQVGGYYVVYKDGYKSYSPAEAFEEGYKFTAPFGQAELPTELDKELKNPEDLLLITIKELMRGYVVEIGQYSFAYSTKEELLIRLPKIID